MKLPCEVVQHIFTLKKGTEGNAVLTLGDRVRCLAVCRAWREYLSPATWPLEELELNFSTGTWSTDDDPPAQWALQTHPKTRSLILEDQFFDFNKPHQYLPQLRSYLSLPHPELQKLNINTGREQMRSLWPAVCALLGLTGLYLSISDGGDSVLDGPMLACLPSTLEYLDSASWPVTEFRWFEPLLLGLTGLAIVTNDLLEMDAALPSLRELVAHGVQEVDLAGANLALPQLTRLDIRSGGAWLDAPITLKVEFGRMPLLASLGVDWVELQAPTASSFASLEHLTRLAVDCRDPTSEAAVLSLLRQAPTGLLSLHAIGCGGSGGDVARALRRMTGLASLTGDCTAAVLPLLESTHALRELEVRLQSDGGCGLQLSSLTQLTKLTADKPSVTAHLAPLRNLRELCFRYVQPAQLTVEQLSQLMAVRSLRKLHFTSAGASDSLFRCLEVFRAALPSCEVMQSDLFEHEHY